MSPVLLPDTANSRNTREKAKAGTKAKLPREECRRVRHDIKFSEWKVLVGPYDWVNHAANVPGVTRFRTQNLLQTFSPGVYELGLVRASLAEKQRRLRSDDVIVVYVGQAEDVRKRMQQYGRDGSHLGVSAGASPLKSSQGEGPCLTQGGVFGEAFERGYAVVFRWSQCASKEEALLAETLLLTSFDYPWNVKLNGLRRLEAIPLAPSDFTAMTKRVVSPFRFVARPITAVKELSPRGPDVAVLHKPHPDHQILSMDPKHVFVATDVGSRSPLPGWLISAYGVRKSPVQSPVENWEARRETGREAHSMQCLETCPDKPVSVHRHATSALQTRPQRVGGSVARPLRGLAPTELKLGNEGLVMCRAPLAGGGACSAVPVKGRQRCAEHKGKRVA